METHSIIQHCKCCEKCDKYCQIQCQLPLNPYKMQNSGNRLSFSKCLAALTFTFAASALGSVGHCSGVWASVQDQQLLWHSVVITARQRGVWRYRQEDREMIFTVSCGNVRIKLPARGTREGECEKERIREVAGMRLTETDSICNRLKMNISSWWHKHSVAIGDYRKSRDLLSAATTEKDK